MKNFIYILILVLLIIPLALKAEDDKTIDVYIFTSEGCPYCAKTLSFLETLKQEEFPEIEIHNFDIRKNPKYYSKYSKFGRAYNVAPDSVPITYIGDKAMEGERLQEIRSTIENCRIKECQNPEEIVKEFIKENSVKAGSAAETSNRQILGWVILSVLIAAGILIVINKI